MEESMKMPILEGPDIWALGENVDRFQLFWTDLTYTKTESDVDIFVQIWDTNNTVLHKKKKNRAKNGGLVYRRFESFHRKVT